MADPVNLYKHYLKEVHPKFGHNGHNVRAVAMFVVYRFTGFSMHKVSEYFGIVATGVARTIKRQQSYLLSGDTQFQKEYNDLLQDFIYCCRIAYRKNTITL